MISLLGQSIPGLGHANSILATEDHERMADVGAWAAQSTNVPAGTEADSESDHNSVEDFADEDSDGDMDIESVTEA